MVEYIDREEAKAKIREKFKFVPARIEINEVLNSIPAADVRPVKRGKWTLNKDGSGTCSECGKTQKNCWDLDNWDNFCHFCGADMREQS